VTRYGAYVTVIMEKACLEISWKGASTMLLEDVLPSLEAS